MVRSSISAPQQHTERLSSLLPELLIFFSNLQLLISGPESLKLSVRMLFEL